MESGDILKPLCFACCLSVISAFIIVHHIKYPKNFAVKGFAIQHCSRVLTAGDKVRIQLTNRSTTGVSLIEAGGVRLVKFDSKLIQQSFKKARKSSGLPFRMAIIGDSINGLLQIKGILRNDHWR